jgi:cytochrome c2
MKAVAVAVVVITCFISVGAWMIFTNLPTRPGPASMPTRDDPNLIAAGKMLTAKHGCIQCHTDNGDTAMGPTFQNFWGSIIRYDDGTGAVVDEANVRASLANPTERIMQGFDAMMPSFEGRFTDDDVKALIAYLKSLSENRR